MVAVVLHRNAVAHREGALLALFNVLGQEAVKSLTLDLDIGTPFSRSI